MKMHSTSSSAKECGICNEEFNGDLRSPRYLPCAHSICKHCTQELINRNEKHCPFCRRHFYATNSEDLGKNTTALDLLNYVKILEEKVESCKTPESRLDWLEEIKKTTKNANNGYISICSELQDKMEAELQEIFELKQSISQTLRNIKVNIKSKITELEEICKAKMQYLEDENKKILKMISNVGDKQKKKKKLNDVLDEATTLTKVEFVLERTEASNNSLKTWLSQVKADVSRVKRVHLGINENMKIIEEKLSGLRDILMSPVEVKGSFIELEAITLQEEKQQHMTPEILQRMSATTRVLVSLQGIYAVQKQKGEARYGRLSFTDNKLCLHHLSDIKPTTDVSTIKFKDVMRLVDPSSRLTFLDFGHKGSRVCRIIVRLTGDTKRSQHFSLLCSGVRGHSFSKTKIRKREKDDQIEYVFCGGYHTKSGITGKALVAGAGKEKGGLLRQSVTEGSVLGSGAIVNSEVKYVDSVGSYFVIVTKVYKSIIHPTVFGKVEEGLDVFKSLELHTNPEEIEIMDCGIVLIE